MENSLKIIAKSPSSCTENEIQDFINFVVSGGEVASDGLERRVRSSAQLIFLQLKNRIVGIAALKRPSARYRSRVASAAGVRLASTTFPYELGWVFVVSEARGCGYSKLLCQAVLEHANCQGVFSTSREENKAMHRTLARVGFVCFGTTYKSQRGCYRLQLFVKGPDKSERLTL